MAEKKTGNSAEVISMIADEIEIKRRIYVIRGQQVMLDADLALLYHVDTGALNRAAKRNEDRFPEDFRFQITKEEYSNLKCQIGISSSNNYGGRRTMPFVYTEQGISMLASVLHSDVAVIVSVKIMRIFVEMRRFISNNQLMFEKISDVELKQLEYQKETDEKFDKVFQYIDDHAESEQKIFFAGQIYDAFSLLTSLVQNAKEKIILIDGYVDVHTLNILAKKNNGVNVEIFTYPSAKLTNDDISNFNAQYPEISVKRTNVFHDRFIILDEKTVYHVGASLKDAGKKCFAISLMEDSDIAKALINRLQNI